MLVAVEAAPSASNSLFKTSSERAKVSYLKSDRVSSACRFKTIRRERPLAFTDSSKKALSSDALIEQLSV